MIDANPTLALSMIVKDAAADLPSCLESVRGFVDEIVIADTGSRDASLQIAREAGDKLIEIPWENDFAKARNASLAQVTADWVLVLDADERLDPDSRLQLSSLITRQDVAGYQVTLRNYVNDLQHKLWDRSPQPNHSTYEPVRAFPACVDHENVRLFRRNPDIYFTGRVHETVGWRILAIDGQIASSSVLIHHLGMMRSAEERARKILFYRDLGKRKVADMPENSQAHFELGLAELENFGNVEEAMASLRRALELRPRFGVAWFFLGVCYFRQAQFPQALENFRRAESCGHFTPWIAELSGDAHYNLGNYESARDAYRRCLKHDTANFGTVSKLGLAEVRVGAKSRGLHRLRDAIASQPHNPEMYDRLMAAQLWLNDLPAGAATAEAKLRAVTPKIEDFLRAASIHSKMNDWTRAIAVLKNALAAFPDSAILKSHLCEIETIAIANTRAPSLGPAPTSLAT